MKALMQMETYVTHVLDTDVTEWVDFTTIAHQPPPSGNLAIWLTV